MHTCTAEVSSREVVRKVMLCEITKYILLVILAVISSGYLLYIHVIYVCNLNLEKQNLISFSNDTVSVLFAHSYTHSIISCPWRSFLMS